jgi:hypothetical protein
MKEKICSRRWEHETLKTFSLSMEVGEKLEKSKVHLRDCELKQNLSSEAISALHTEWEAKLCKKWNHERWGKMTSFENIS